MNPQPPGVTVLCLPAHFQFSKRGVRHLRRANARDTSEIGTAILHTRDTSGARLTDMAARRGEEERSDHRACHEWWAIF